MKRRTIIEAGLASTALSLAGVARAQGYPNRFIRWVVPSPAGGPFDIVARKLAELVSAELHQPVVIDNKPGAGGAIGTAEVARAAPDGYTFGVAGTDALISAVLLLKNPGYDTRRDLSLLMQVSSGPQILVAHPKLGVSSLPELVAAAKARPDTISYVSWGPGSRPELIFMTLGRERGASMINVPYRGLSAAVQDLLEGRVQVAIIPVGMTLDYRGKLNPRAVLGGERAAELPQLSTSREQGVDLPIMSAQMWTGIFAPRGLPSEIQQRWIEVLQKAIRSPSFGETLRVLGQSAIGKHSEQFTREFGPEFELIAETIKRSGLTPQ